MSEEKQKTDVEKQIESMDPALAKSFQRINEIIDQREEERAYQLALWPDKDIGSPNELSRSALFPAIHPKKRAGLQNHMIAAQGSYTIYYTGLQLDQSYFDVFQGVMHIGRGVQRGQRGAFFSPPAPETHRTQYGRQRSQMAVYGLPDSHSHIGSYRERWETRLLGFPPASGESGP